MLMLFVFNAALPAASWSLARNCVPSISNCPLHAQVIYQNNTKAITHFVIAQQSQVGDGDVTALAQKIAQAARVRLHPRVTRPVEKLRYVKIVFR